MTRDRFSERDMARLLSDLAMPSQPWYRDELVQLTAETRQRPAWMFPERWIPVDTTLRRTPVAALNPRRLVLLGLLVLAAVVAVVVATGAVRKPPLPPYGPAANGVMVYEAGFDIFLVDRITGETRPIAEGSDYDSDPRFSPDGRKIAFVRYGANGSYGVLADADGSNVHPMPGKPCKDCTGWGWMGDSRTIWATSTVPGSEIMLHDTVTGEHTAIDVPGEVMHVAPRPPDDLEIGFVTQLADDRAVLYSMNRDGSDLKALATTGESNSFAYSPDGSRIAYEANAAGVDMWTIHIVGSDGRDDIELPRAPWLIHQGGPAWSPDGQTLLVWRTYSTHGGPIFSILKPNGELVRDITSLEIAGDWAFSPDGTSIVYVTNVATARETGRCPDGDRTTCPSVVIKVSDGTLTTLPFTPVSLSYQRASP